MQQINWAKILKICMLALCVSSVGAFMWIPLGTTAFWWLIKGVIFVAMFSLWDKTYHPVQIMIWMTLVLVSCLIGCFYCEDYWNWKHLINNVINYSICAAAMMAIDPDIIQEILHFLYKHIWKLFVLLVFFMMSDGIAKFLLPFTFLALFYPVLNKKYRIYVWIALTITLAFGLDNRSEMLKSLFCIFVGLFSLRHEIVKYTKKFYWLFYVAPIVLFYLGASGSFNVFDMEHVFNVSADETSRLDMTDTRTLLYEEVISTSKDRGTIWLGNTPARGYVSGWITRNNDQSDIMGDMHYGERGNAESSVLNVFLHFGIFGMVVYFFLFLSASFLGIFRSENTYVPVVGLYVAFRYMAGWVEDFTNFDMNMFLLWTMIGICYSPFFRTMSNEEFEDWLAGIMA